MSGMTMAEVDARIKDLEYQRKHLGMDDEEFVREIGNIMSLEETSVLFREIVKENQDLRRQLAAAAAKIAADEIQFGKCADEIEATHRQLAELQPRR